jgi:hypothetical protein
MGQTTTAAGCLFVTHTGGQLGSAAEVD